MYAKHEVLLVLRENHVGMHLVVEIDSRAEWIIGQLSALLSILPSVIDQSLPWRLSSCDGN